MDVGGYCMCLSLASLAVSRRTGTIGSDIPASLQSYCSLCFFKRVKGKLEASLLLFDPFTTTCSTILGSRNYYCAASPQIETTRR